MEKDTIKKADMKEKKIPQQNEKTSWNQDLLQKSHQRNKHYGSPPCKVLRTILKMDEKWTQKNGRQDKKIDLQGFTPRDDIDRIYTSRKKGGRGPTSIKNCVDASIQGLEDYIKKN